MSPSSVLCFVTVLLLRDRRSRRSSCERKEQLRRSHISTLPIAATPAGRTDGPGTGGDEIGLKADIVDRVAQFGRTPYHRRRTLTVDAGTTADSCGQVKPGADTMPDDDLITEDQLEAASTREELADLLNELHILADRPSLRDLNKWSVDKAKRTQLAKTTVADMLAGKRLPSKAVLLTFVEACDVPEDRLGPWKKAWGRIAVAERNRPPLKVELDRLRQQTIQDANKEAEDYCNQLLADAHLEASVIREEAHQQVHAEIQAARQAGAIAAEKIKADAESFRGQLEIKARLYHEETLADAKKRAELILEEARQQAQALQHEASSKASGSTTQPHTDPLELPPEMPKMPELPLYPDPAAGFLTSFTDPDPGLCRPSGGLSSTPPGTAHDLDPNTLPTVDELLSRIRAAGDRPSST